MNLLNFAAGQRQVGEPHVTEHGDSAILDGGKIGCEGRNHR
jgi:hypothetical protein